VIDPCNADAIAFSKVADGATPSRDVTDDLMSRDHRVPRRCDASFGDIEISSADSAERDVQEQLAILCCRGSDIGELQQRRGAGVLAGIAENHRAHSC